MKKNFLLILGNFLTISRVACYGQFEFLLVVLTLYAHNSIFFMSPFCQERHDCLFSLILCVNLTGPYMYIH